MSAHQRRHPWCPAGRRRGGGIPASSHPTTAPAPMGGVRGCGRASSSCPPLRPGYGGSAPVVVRPCPALERPCSTPPLFHPCRTATDRAGGSGVHVGWPPGPNCVVQRACIHMHVRLHAPLCSTPVGSHRQARGSGVRVGWPPGPNYAVSRACIPYACPMAHPLGSTPVGTTDRRRAVGFTWGGHPARTT